MSFPRSSLRLLAPVLLCATLSTAAVSEEKEQKLTVDQLPAAVKTTLLAQAGGATLSEYEKETKHGKTVYTAEMPGKEAGTVIELTVAEDGTFLGKETEKADVEEKGEHK